MPQQTLAIIKPDAVKKRVVGKIISRIEDEGFTIARLKLVHLTLDEAQGFYAVHREKKFFASLTEFMSSGPCFVMVLEAEEAIRRWREVMGATDPTLAEQSARRDSPRSREAGRSCRPVNGKIKYPVRDIARRRLRRLWVVRGELCSGP